MNANLITLAHPWRRLFAANQTGASITTPTPQTTAPSGQNVIDQAAVYEPPSNLVLAFFGAGADNVTATARITGWRRALLDGSTPLWVPTPLSAISLTFSSMVGVAGAAVLATDRFADTLVESTVYTAAKEIISPADNTLALLKLDIFGHELVQVDVAIGTATNVNGLWAGF